MSFWSKYGKRVEIFAGIVLFVLVVIVYIFIVLGAINLYKWRNDRLTLLTQECVYLFEQKNFCDEIYVEDICGEFESFNCLRVVYGCGMREYCVCDFRNGVCELVEQIEKEDNNAQ